MVAHKETKALATFALVAGKKPLLKEAEETEQTGCKPRSNSGGGALGKGAFFWVYGAYLRSRVLSGSR
ncbi:MAG TPA: hypothetical protein VKU19_34030 [Bryobacteraceae bacterium]|nr:hypothetical protein [Bryobacteraceae bacterium]